MAKVRSKGQIPVRRYGQGGLIEETCFNGAHLLEAKKRLCGNKVKIVREIQSAVMNKGRRLTKKVVEWLEEIAEKCRIAADFLAIYQYQAPATT